MTGSLGGRRLTRRSLIGAGAALLGAGAVGKIISTPTLADAAPPTSAWKALATELDGTLLRPGDDGYVAAVRTFDPRRDVLRPLAIARVAGPADVAAVFAFCRRYAISPRPRAGGHSYVGASTGTGVMVIDTGGLRAIHYDAGSKTVTIGPGVRLGDLHAVLDQHGRTIPTGTCPTVGAAGLTLGGGIGTESRLYGLTADALIRATMVGPAGHTHQPAADNDRELFWGLRGGGGGNFGIVTRLSYQTRPALPGTIFRLGWGHRDNHRVLLGWQERLAHMPRHSWANLHLDTGGGTVFPSITGVCWGSGASAEISALLNAIGKQPLSRQVFRESHAGAMSWFAGGANGYRRQSWYAGSDVVGRTISSGRAYEIIRAVGSWNGSGGAAAIFDPLGGAVSDPQVDDTAFRWRNAHATVQWYAGLSDTSAGNLNRAADWVARCHDAAGPCSVGGYVNYLEPHRELSSYYGDNYARLVALNRRYDPDHVLNAPYSLPG